MAMGCGREMVGLSMGVQNISQWRAALNDLRVVGYDHFCISHTPRWDDLFPSYEYVVDGCDLSVVCTRLKCDAGYLIALILCRR